MELPVIELKFLRRLLEHPPDYRTPISQIQPNAKTSAAERDRICKSLCSKGMVEYAEEILRYRTTVTGKTLLYLDRSVLPATPDELLLLKAAVARTATPSDAKKVSIFDRQQLLRQLAAQRLITVRQSQITDVWLTPRGQRYLQEQCPAPLLPGQHKR
jgi:hypothetical protein